MMPTILARCGFNTQPPEGGWTETAYLYSTYEVRFQHTAARRRLVLCLS